MNRPDKKTIRPDELKSHDNRSHNQDLALIHLVKFLARNAAEEDYKAHVDKLSNQKIKGEEQ